MRLRASTFSGEFILLALLLLLTSCGLESAPHPPSLYLPQPVTDLTAERIGNEVHLHWTMPKRSTDRVKLEGLQQAVLCRGLSGTPCERVGKAAYAPGAAADFTDHLPTSLVSGPPQLLVYTVELTNRKGHSAGASNPAYTAAGAAPESIAGLSAEVHANGILLRWQPAQGAGNFVRLDRVLTNPHQTSSDSMAGVPPPVEQKLETAYAANHDPGGTLDEDAALDFIYRYTARRVATFESGGHKVEVASTPSGPIVVNARDVFPPAVPAGLVTVANPEGHSIDLSWTPDQESDLAGYIVYRREAGSNAAPVRISPAQPITAPAFSDTSVKSGLRYAYSVSAIYKDHNESARSAEVEETLPQQQE
jgi:hypothetical protein